MPDLDLDPILLLPLALVFFLMAMPILSRKIWGPVEHILPFHVHQKLAATEPMALLDIRNARSYTAERIDGAERVGVEDLDRVVAEKSQDNRPVVLVCQSDLSSTRHAARLRKAGYGNVLVMKGGMHAWKRAKLPVVTA